jgi:hypothetical protein
MRVDPHLQLLADGVDELEGQIPEVDRDDQHAVHGCGFLRDLD